MLSGSEDLLQYKDEDDDDDEDEEENGDGDGEDHVSDEDDNNDDDSLLEARKSNGANVKDEKDSETGTSVKGTKIKIDPYISKSFSNRVDVAPAEKTKTRLRLSLKLPIMKNSSVNPAQSAPKKLKLILPRIKAESSPETKSRDTGKSVEDDMTEVQAVVVDSDDDGDDDAVATAVPESSISSNVATAKSDTPRSNSGNNPNGKSIVSASTSASLKRRPMQLSKQIRIPPIPSPGLLIPAPSSSKTGFTTPCDLFDKSMEASGYTLEKRTQQPHRGSSIKRRVDDMFDSNVMLSLNFPTLVPKKLMRAEIQTGSKSEHEGIVSSNAPIKTEDTTDKKESVEEIKSVKSLPQQLIQCFESIRKELNINMKGVDRSDDVAASKGETGPSVKRKRHRLFRDMVPVSLTLPYPEPYIQERLKYVHAVQKREKAIVEWQDAMEKLESEETNLRENGNPALADSLNLALASIPEIPQMPDPPLIKDMVGLDASLYKEDQHPIYLPSNKIDLVSHLDRLCFHVSEGRYFGLSTNFIADPNFIGANAPGIAAINLSGGTGLATSTAGLTINPVAPSSLNLSSAYRSSSSVVPNAPKAPEKVSSSVSKSTSNVTEKIDPIPKKTSKSLPLSSSLSSPNAEPQSKSKKIVSGSSSNKNKSRGGLKPTATVSQLRKAMEEGGTAAETLKKCIIRAAVHASRTSKHGQPFVAPNGETYPDVGKAFAAHAGIKPCQRCKSNKQGVYHCRLRRRHEDPDYDGGNSANVLKPLFKEPLDSILRTDSK